MLKIQFVKLKYILNREWHDWSYRNYKYKRGVGKW